jgi:hypothetical protein
MRAFDDMASLSSSKTIPAYVYHKRGRASSFSVSENTGLAKRRQALQSVAGKI